MITDTEIPKSAIDNQQSAIVLSAVQLRIAQKIAVAGGDPRCVDLDGPEMAVYLGISYESLLKQRWGMPGHRALSAHHCVFHLATFQAGTLSVGNRARRRRKRNC